MGDSAMDVRSKRFGPGERRRAKPEAAGSSADAREAVTASAEFLSDALERAAAGGSVCLVSISAVSGWAALNDVQPVLHVPSNTTDAVHRRTQLARIIHYEGGQHSC